MSVRKMQNVSLTPELEAFIDGRVAAGRYRSASEGVRAALCLLADAETGHRERKAPPGVRATKPLNRR